MNILALDIGTSSVKCAVLDQESGQAIGPIARQAYALHQPDAETAVIQPDELWQTISKTVHLAGSEHAVAGIGISCLTPCLALLGAADQPIVPFITHLDRRSRSTAKMLDQRFGPSFLRETGNRPLPGGISGVAFKHLAAQQPQILSQVRRYLHLNGWLALRLTGQTAFDPGNACFSGLCAWTEAAWSQEWCAQLDVLLQWLPAIVPGNTTIGGLRDDIAQQWGLTPGIPVKIGLADTSSAILAAGMQPGELLHLVGTTQVLAVLTDEPRPSETRLTRHFGVGESYLHVTHNPVGGAALEWLRQLCFADKASEEYYGPIIDAALERKTNIALDPPYLGGDRLEIEDRKAGFKGLNLASDRMDLLAATLGAMRSGHRLAWSHLDRPTPPRRVFLSGGGATIIRKLIPDYSNLEVIELHEASLLGVARLFSS